MRTLGPSPVLAQGTHRGRKGAQNCRSLRRLASIEISVFEFADAGASPPHPQESLLTTLPLASCQRHPSGRHRTRKLDGASDGAITFRAWWTFRSTGFQPVHHLSARVENPCYGEVGIRAPTTAAT